MTGATPEKQLRQHFPYVLEIATRWSDFDMLRHLNNVQYYRLFEYIILDNLANIGTDWIRDQVIPLTVESSCNFRKPIAVARTIDAGLRVTHIGNSSVRYEIGLFEKGRELPSAFGYFVHVYLDRDTEISTAVPESIRHKLGEITVEGLD